MKNRSLFHPLHTNSFLLCVLTTLFVFTLFGSSCVRRNTEELLFQEAPMPVVFSVLSPGMPVKVYLSQTITKKQLINKIIYPNAEVYILDENNFQVELTRASIDTILYTDHNKEIEIMAGKTYQLQIKIDDLLLTAETTIPIQKALIKEASLVISHSSPGGYNSKTGVLNVNMDFPDNNFGYFLDSSSYQFDETPFLTAENYTMTDIQIHPDSSLFTLELITCSPLLKNYRLADFINKMKESTSHDLMALIGAFSGTLPHYSNIKNGVGLFAGYDIDRKAISITHIE